MPRDVDVRGIQTELQSLIGAAPIVEVGKFHNWASTQIRTRVLTVSPRSVEEVQRVVVSAKELGLQVRAAGTGHSWSPLFADEGHVLLYTKRLERPDGRPRIELLQNPADGKRKFVAMATSVTVKEFKAFQLSHGVCLPANVIFGVAQMGGVVSPACHGAGWDTHTVSDYVYKMRIVDSSGQLREYSRETDEDMMRAVQCSLGLWGIIIDITIKVDQMVIVETENQWIKVKDLFYDKDVLCNLLHKNWSVELFWFPYNGISSSEAVEAFLEKEVDLGEWDPKEDDVWVRLVNKPESAGDVQSECTYKIMELRTWLQMKGFDVFDGFISRCPQAAPAFLKSQIPFLKDQFKGKVVQQLPHAVHFLTNVEDVPVNEMEWAFSLDRDCSNLILAIQEVITLVNKEALEGRFPMNLPLEVRFIADSKAYMAPAICANKNYAGSGHTCYIEVLTIAGTPGWLDFSEKVYNIWSKLSGARPHWSKEWEHLPGIDNFIRKAYAQQIPKFLSALESSGADPEGVFLNQRLEQIFFPKGHPGRSKSSSSLWGDMTRRGSNSQRRQYMKMKRASQMCCLL